MNLRTTDLNLLVILQQLLLERHVSRAAERLNMSQPATSRALQRLRDMFSDPLLVKTPKGYDLSSRATALLPQLNQLLENTERLITEPTFDPATSTRTVRFYGPAPEITRFLPKLFQRIQQRAPHMNLEALSTPGDHFVKLENDEVDFIFPPGAPATNTAQLRSMTLETFDFTVVMSADNPLANGPLTMTHFLKANHGYISLTGRGQSLLEQNLRQKGFLKQNERLRCPLKLESFSAVGPFCEHSDVIFNLPRFVAKEIAKGRNIVIKDVPPEIQMDKKTDKMYWHERHHKDPMCRWVREQVKAIRSDWQ